MTTQSKTDTLHVKGRERLGSRHSRRLRAGGMLPGIIYGHGHKPAPITLEAKEAIRRIESGEKVFVLTSDGDIDQKTVLLKDLQFDYLGNNIIHVDLAIVDLKELVEVSVPIRCKGDSVGLKTAGAVLLHPSTEITIRCRVTDIPDSISLEISELDLGQVIHARELTLEVGFELLSDPDDVLAAIHLAKKEEVAEEVEAIGEGGEPEVLGEKSDDEAKKE